MSVEPAKRLRGQLVGFRRSAAVVAVLAAVLAVGLGFTLARAADAPPVAPTPDAVSVDGSQLLRGGADWIPRAVQIVGLVAPDRDLQGKYVAAHDHFGAAELSAAVADHVDTIRFQVSQFGLDPQDPMYSASYAAEVERGVALARQLGLNAIVSLQAQAPAGRNGRCPLPDAGAARAWQTLAPMFAGDPGVMFELYNEPGIAAGRAGWETWLDGGEVIQPNGLSCFAVGTQPLIDMIRSSAPRNVIIVPGLAGEQTLAGMPVVTDPANPTEPQLAYGIHYPSLTQGSVAWDRAFGRASANVPVIVTEWDQNSSHNCITDGPAKASLLLAYLASKKIGVVGFAFDLPGTIVVDYSYAPTSYDAFACGNPSNGPGALLFGEYAALANAAGTTGGIPVAWIVNAGLLRQLDSGHAALVRQLFNNPRTFVVGATSSTLTSLGVPTAIATARFTNERTLAATVNRGALPAGTVAVMYDDQPGSSTPSAQRRHPGFYYHSAAEIAHENGLLLAATPAAGLAQRPAGRATTSQTYERFLKRGIASAAARYADVYQTQPLPGSAPFWFVRTAMAQADAANPGVELLADFTSSIQATAEPLRMLSATFDPKPRLSGFRIGSSRPCRRCASSPSALVSALRAIRAG
jgi:hypothetical protein